MNKGQAPIVKIGGVTIGTAESAMKVNIGYKNVDVHCTEVAWEASGSFEVKITKEEYEQMKKFHDTILFTQGDSYYVFKDSKGRLHFYNSKCYVPTECVAKMKEIEPNHSPEFLGTVESENCSKL